ncbi:MAG TPA: hypothetical protein DER09_15570 [Prolixibacteraceae bacterium]|nr:hypothetical protein [Prolixibacteraceae bacterium]
MNYDKNYPIPFKNQMYFLRLDQVKKLLKISEYNGSNIEVTICTKEGGEVTGFVKDFKGHYLLSPAEVYIPIVFHIDTNDGIREFNFLEVDSIEIKN